MRAKHRFLHALNASLAQASHRHGSREEDFFDSGKAQPKKLIRAAP